MADIEAQLNARGFREFWDTRTGWQKVNVSLFAAAAMVVVGSGIYSSMIREVYRDYKDPKEAIERAQLGPNRPIAIVQLEDNRQYVVAFNSDGKPEARYQKDPFSMPKP